MRTMKVRYTGETLGVLMLTHGKVYECLEVLETEGFGMMLRIIDDEGWDAPKLDDDPYGYVYSAAVFEIVEDDEAGSLKKAIYG